MFYVAVIKPNYLLYHILILLYISISHSFSLFLCLITISAYPHSLSASSPCTHPSRKLAFQTSVIVKEIGHYLQSKL